MHLKPKEDPKNFKVQRRREICNIAGFLTLFNHTLDLHWSNKKNILEGQNDAYHKY